LAGAITIVWIGVAWTCWVLTNVTEFWRGNFVANHGSRMQLLRRSHSSTTPQHQPCIPLRFNNKVLTSSKTFSCDIYRVFVSRLCDSVTASETSIPCPLCTLKSLGRYHLVLSRTVLANKSSENYSTLFVSLFIMVHLTVEERN
jgi:hypothetical protein